MDEGKAYRRNSAVPKCGASGDDYYSYGVTDHPDTDGKALCPKCGKRLKIVVKTVTGRRRYCIPAHNMDGTAQTGWTVAPE